MSRLRRSSATPVVAQERRKGGAAVLVGAAVLFGSIPIVPRAGAGAATVPNGPAVFAANAEAWAYSAEIGVPGPLGPLASHTTASVDNSPHAQGAAGLADPGYLVRAAAGLVAGVPTPAYCESAWPEGPDHSDCGAPGGARVAVSSTASGDGPNATATAGLADAAVPAALTIAAQSTTSSAFLAPDGVLHATADAVLSGIAVAGGALRIGTLAVHRDATATGLPGETQTNAAIHLSGATVGGQPVDPGSDPVRSLVEAARKAFGNTIAVEGLSGNEERGDAGKLAADSSGLRITWHPQPDRFVRVVLGYGRVLVYATNPPDGTVPGAGGLPAVPPSSAPAAIGVVDAGSSGTEPSPAAPAAVLPSTAPVQPVIPDRAVTDTVASPAGDSAPPPESIAVAAPPAAVPTRPPLAFGTRPPVQWVSPFLVLAQMTTGRQAWWFLVGLVPLLAAAWLARRSGLGLVAPWAAGGHSREP